jgi:hypothetical protein
MFEMGPEGKNVDDRLSRFEGGRMRMRTVEGDIV